MSFCLLRLRSIYKGPAKRVTGPSKFELGQLALAYVVGDRVKAALFGLLLAVFGQDVFDELGAKRVECLGRLLLTYT